MSLRPMPDDWHEVVIIGAGPAGLTAALVLGRCRRKVLVCDAGEPRNARSHALHCFLSREGMPPADLLACGRDQLSIYPSVAYEQVEIVDAAPIPEGFRVLRADGHEVRCRKLLLATGVRDCLPDIPGFSEHYGTSVHHCPYCDAWEHRDQRLVVYGRGMKGYGLALMLKQWSTQVSLCTNGPEDLDAAQLARLQEHDIPLYEQRIDRLEGDGKHLTCVSFNDGQRLACDALFFNTGQYQRSPLLEKLGCEFSDRGGAETHVKTEETCVSGLYVAGDASRDVQLIIVAAAEGAKAAFAINNALLAEAGLS